MRNTAAIMKQAPSGTTSTLTPGSPLNVNIPPAKNPPGRRMLAVIRLGEIQRCGIAPQHLTRVICHLGRPLKSYEPLEDCAQQNKHE
jgi:hypothetical protein